MVKSLLFLKTTITFPSLYSVEEFYKKLLSDGGLI